MQVARHSIDSASALRRYRNRSNPQPMDAPAVNSVCDSVYLVEGSSSVRTEISAYLSVLQLRVIAFASARECLRCIDSDIPACVILNIQLPDGCGLELQRQLAIKSNPPPIFIADRCDIPSMVSAMKAGAMDLLTNPLDLAALAESVRVAFERGRRQWMRKAALAKLRERLSLLTPREREVLPLIVGGFLNKQAASLLGTSEVTLQIHRSQVIRKMQAGSVAELVRMAVELRIPYRRLPIE
jgi:FixJ family two-component response regulator